MMSDKTPQISLDRLREIVKEELSTVNEQVDHAAIKDIVTHASKLLAAVETFKKNAGPSAINGVTPHIDALEKILEDMVSSPSSYVSKPKAELKKVSLRAVKGNV